MTYSIVAADPAAGLVGVAAQSHHLAVGSQLAFAEPGIAAVAVQSYADRGYGQAIVEAMRHGLPAGEALARRVRADRRAGRAQVAVVSAAGEAAVHTGGRCVPAAGHAIGVAACAQANMVESQAVWHASLESFAASGGHLAERMLAALDAAEAAGGDLRGCQSAVLLVVGADGERIDVRVDDAAEPLAELRRLTTLQRAGHRMTAAFRVAAAGRIDEATEMLAAVQVEFGPDNLEPTVWAAVLLARAGDEAQAATLLSGATAKRREWSEFIRRLARVGLFPDDARLIAAVTGASQ